MFHALPISRGKSITKSHWIQDMGEFYGPNIFLAETSSTTGGLDSLLQPHGPAQARAGEDGARLRQPAQLLRHQRHLDGQQDRDAGAVRPGDIVLRVARLPQVAPLRAGARGANPGLHGRLSAASEYTMYGGVPLAEIKPHLLRL